MPPHTLGDVSVCVLQKASSDVQRKELEQRIIFELGTLHPVGMNMDISVFIQNWFLPWRRYTVSESLAKKFVSTVTVFLFSFSSDHGAMQPFHIYLTWEECLIPALYGLTPGLLNRVKTKENWSKNVQMLHAIKQLTSHKGCLRKQRKNIEPESFDFNLSN